MPDYQRMPLFPLNTVLFPGLSIPLQIFEPRYLLMIQRCLEKGAPFGVVLIRSGTEVGDELVISTVGTTARITRYEAVSDELITLEVEGETRFTIEETFDAEPYMTGHVTPLWEQDAEPLSLQPLYDQTVALFRVYLEGLLSEGNRHLAQLQMPQDPVVMSFAVAASLQTSLFEKQALLELSTTSERLEREIQILRREQATSDFVDVTGSDSPMVQTFVPLDSASVQKQLSRN
jgi:Lon protease-like protein